MGHDELMRCSFLYRLHRQGFDARLRGLCVSLPGFDRHREESTQSYRVGKVILLTS